MVYPSKQEQWTTLDNLQFSYIYISSPIWDHSCNHSGDPRCHPNHYFRCKFRVIRIRNDLNHVTLHVELRHHLGWLHLTYCFLCVFSALLVQFFVPLHQNAVKINYFLFRFPFFMLPLLIALCQFVKIVYNTNALFYEVLHFDDIMCRPPVV